MMNGLNCESYSASAPQPPRLVDGFCDDSSAYNIIIINIIITVIKHTAKNQCCYKTFLRISRQRPRQRSRPCHRGLETQTEKTLSPRSWDQGLVTKVLRPRLRRPCHRGLETKALSPRSWDPDWEDLVTKVLKPRPCHQGLETQTEKTLSSRSWDRDWDLVTEILRPRPIRPCHQGLEITTLQPKTFHWIPPVTSSCHPVDSEAIFLHPFRHLANTSQITSAWTSCMP